MNNSTMSYEQRNSTSSTVNKVLDPNWKQPLPNLQAADTGEAMLSASNDDNGFAKKEATVARSLSCALQQLQTGDSPFTWDNHVSLALPVVPSGKNTANPLITELLQAYYQTLAQQFLTVPLALPKPFLQGSTYRQFCFHAWLGEALMKALVVK